MKQVHLQAAYVLHRRAYRETSFLVELLTRDYGRLTVVAKGARTSKSPWQGILQPFIPLVVSWTGKSELMTLTQAETVEQYSVLSGDCLFAGFYINELVMALLEKWDAHPAFYDYYHKTMKNLRCEILEEKLLRAFEKFLLSDMGYGFLSKSDSNALCEDKYYRFIPEQGFVMSELGGEVKAKDYIFSGASLLAIANEEWEGEQTLRDAKRLSRMILTSLLGARTIHSRRLFMPLKVNEYEE